MHGYLMHLRLYNRLRDKLHSADLTERRQKRIDELATQ